MPSPWDWVHDALLQWDEQHLRRVLTERSGRQARQIVVDSKPYLNFGSNDYLGLAGDDRMLRAVRDSLAQSGWGAGASPLILGRADLHAELERRLATFEQSEAALLFPTGFAANLGTVPCLVDKSDVVFSDALNHASLIDGCRLSRAKICIYQHGDMMHLRELLQNTTRRRRLIVSDSLFSMDGDFAPLPELVALAEEFDAMLLVDEAHATGVWGASGRGMAEHFHLESRVPLRVGTLSKALGSIGGFIVGSNSLIQWCVNQARTYIFSTAAPAATCAAAITALDVVRDEPDRRFTVRTLSESLRARLNSIGLDTGKSSSQIVPILLGDAERTLQVTKELERKGLFVPAIRPPSVPPNASRLRISLTASHSESDITQLIDALKATL